MKIKRLFFDIETSPNIGFFWSSGYRKTISPDNIIKERVIICICYKWEEEDKVNYLSWDENQDDKKMLSEFIQIANQADELVGHNGDKFDLAWIRTRCLYHNISMFPNYVTIDTLKQARSKFKFNSNKLNYIAQFLGIGEKIHTEFNLWKDIVLNNDREKLSSMVEYCKKDVELLEKVFHKMNVHLPAKTHFGVINGGEKYSCPSCGSEKSTHSKTRTTALGTIRVQLQCKECHKYHTISNTAYTKYILEKNTR
jgi:DNA polymerase elongation subunit (family B)